VSASGFSSLTQCRAPRGNKISREMVSMVASLPLRRRGFTHGYDSSRIHAPLYRLHAQHSADRSAAAHRSGVSARDRPSGGSVQARARYKELCDETSRPKTVSVSGGAWGSGGPWGRAAQAQYGRERALQLQVLRLQAEGVADKIGQFIKEIEAQLAWTTELPPSSGSIVELPFDVLRRWPSAVTELSQLDSSGKQQLKVSRVVEFFDSPTDFSQEFTVAMAKGSSTARSICAANGRT
jgi:hypothetical protein